MQNRSCEGCGLELPWCCCSQIEPQQCQLEFALLLHENEHHRATATSKIIQQVLPTIQLYQWQRKDPPKALLERINAADTEVWLLFPADRPELITRSRPFKPAEKKRSTLIIVPDGTWKEVRKIVRKSPWLDQLPILSFSPARKSRYDLRRNPDADHLCTAETVAELLKLNREVEAASELDRALDRFIHHYKRARQNLPL